MERREEIAKGIPQQKKGNQLDVQFAITASSLQEARQLFHMAVERLLDVHVWEKLCGPLSASFKLMDNQGREVHRQVQPGDYFRIDIPAPGPSSGGGYDWVKVEEVLDKQNPTSREESIAIRVRPTASPVDDQPSTAHFFHEQATSSFVVERRGNVVKAEVHGRNEIPNVSSEKTIDKMRNAVVGSGAITGFSAAQWKKLVKGLLDTSMEV
jgi:hypothetical protein